MKSSSICLLHVPGANALPGGANACSDEDKLTKGAQPMSLGSPSAWEGCSAMA